MTDGPIRVLGLSGSLRSGSFNTAALRAAIELTPATMTIDTAGIGDLPLYDEDLRQRGMPEPAIALRRRIAAADAVLLVTPEYNFSVPGVLKNAIDWASRPPNQPFDGKPVAIMSASTGQLGGARAQYHLRQMLVYLNAFPLNKPEVMIRQAREKFDDDGRLIDEPTRDFIRALLAALEGWVRRLGAVAP